MAIQVNNLLTRAAIQLLDPQNVRWTRNELLAWINDAQRVIARFNPESVVTTQDSHPLVDGGRQVMPDGSIELIDIESVTVDGTVYTAREVDKSLLDESFPQWQNDVVEIDEDTSFNFMYDERNPKEFYVYPPLTDANATARVVFAKTPSNVGATDNIELDDIYGDIILDYVLYRCFMKEEEETAIDQTKAFGYLTTFGQALGQKFTLDQAVRREI